MYSLEKHVNIRVAELDPGRTVVNDIAKQNQEGVTGVQSGIKLMKPRRPSASEAFP